MRGFDAALRDAGLQAGSCPRISSAMADYILGYSHPSLREERQVPIRSILLSIRLSMRRLILLSIRRLMRRLKLPQRDRIEGGAIRLATIWLVDAIGGGAADGRAP
jgi:hypothetical protein